MFVIFDGEHAKTMTETGFQNPLAARSCILTCRRFAPAGRVAQLVYRSWLKLVYIGKK